jgi:hypothetical protein
MKPVMPNAITRIRVTPTPAHSQVVFFSGGDGVGP